jgi:predicted enzyme related to lactoylglutathione lyase
MTVTETFIAVGVRDMQRATDFYVEALGATVKHASPIWSSLRIAGVRVGLFPNDTRGETWTGLHFAVTDLAEACAAIERAGGRVVVAAAEVAPGVVVADVRDTEGNVITLRGP